MCGETHKRICRLKIQDVFYQENRWETERAKGIRTDKIGLDDYKNVLNTDCTKHLIQMKSIRSDHHEIKTYKNLINKKGLRAYDDKRYIFDDGINTLAYRRV